MNHPKIRFALPVLLTALIVGMGLNGFADSLGDLEKSLFDYTSEELPAEQRLERLESLVFGSAQQGTATEREARLQSALEPVLPQKFNPPPGAGYAGYSDQTATPAGQGSEAASFAPTPGGTPYDTMPPPPRDATDYPTVTTMEQQVFGRDFVHEDIAKRLERLERKVFETTYPNLPLVDRVDRLTFQVPAVFSSDPTASIRHRTNFSNNAKERGGPLGSMHKALDEMEQTAFGSVSEGKLISERLDALERRNFGQTFSHESIDTRFSRLQQQLQYARQQPQPNYTGYRSPPSTQSRPGFVRPGQTVSPDVYNMAPNDVQNQLRGQGYNPVYQEQHQTTTPFGTSTRRYSSGFTTSAPGTVIYQETRTYPLSPYSTNSNFQRFGTPNVGVGTGMGSGMVGGFTTHPGGLGRNMSSVVQGPMGGMSGTTHPSSPRRGFYTNPTTPYYNQTQTYVMPGQQVYTDYGQNYTGNPGFYNMNPAILQELDNLENSVLGTSHPADTVTTRLTRLELKMLGQTYSNHPPEDRMNNLLRARQGQSLGRIFGKGKAGDIGRGIGTYMLGVPMQQPDF